MLKYIGKPEHFLNVLDNSWTGTDPDQFWPGLVISFKELFPIHSINYSLNPWCHGSYVVLTPAPLLDLDVWFVSSRSNQSSLAKMILRQVGPNHIIDALYIEVSR